MSRLKIAAAAAVPALAASPCLAFTVTPSTSGGQPQARMANSETMMDGAGAPFQDAAVRNSVVGPAGSAGFSSSGAYYGSTTSNFNFGGVQGSTTVNSYPGSWNNYSNTAPGYLPYSNAPPPYYYARRH